MPLEEIRAVLSAPDLRVRNQRISAHLSRMEEELGRAQSAVDSLRGLLAVPAGGIYADEVFTRHRGQVTVFVPCTEPVPPTGRISTTLIPAADLAVIEHQGAPADVDRAYGMLASYVARHALAVEGPIREYYLTGPQDTPDTTQWRTEIGWPIFRTTSA